MQEPEVRTDDAPPPSRWLPREEFESPRTMVGVVADTRHRGRYLFFAGFHEGEPEAGAKEPTQKKMPSHQLLFRSTSSHGAMDDNALRWVKRRLRPGDRVSVVVHAVEPPADPTHEAPLLHVTSITMLDLSIRSNTGVERTCAAMSETEQQAALIAESSAPDGGEQQARHQGDDDGDDREHPHKQAAPADDARHRERANVFAQWVLRTYGPLLRQESADPDAPPRTDTVLDVGGGRGELSLALTLAGVEGVTLIDPRPSSGYLSKWQRKLLRRSGQRPFEVAHELFGEAGGDASAQRAQRAKLVLGMHPDEVTETIVDAALAARTPFAVVPCCVFSRLFPHRRLPSGQFVTTHAQLCEYLRAKDPEHIRITTLPFAGKSTVVYWTPPTASADGQGAPIGDGVVRDTCVPCDDNDETST